MQKSKLLELLESSSETEIRMIENFFIEKLLKDLDKKNSPIMDYIKQLEKRIKDLEEEVEFQKVNDLKSYTYDWVSSNNAANTVSSSSSSSTVTSSSSTVYYYNG